MNTARCSHLQLAATSRRRSLRTFNPKVAGSIPARPITDTAQTMHPVCRDARSGFAADGDLEGFANLTHSLIAESAEALDERSERYALD
jgi:hypothetical protein